MFSFVKRLFSEFGRDKAGQMSAAFAYVAIFAIGPLLLILVSIVGFIYGPDAAAGKLYDQLSSVMGDSAAKSLQSLIANTASSGKNVFALVIGTIGLLLAATALTNQLQNSFNSIFRAAPDPGAGIKKTIYTKLKNIILLVIACLAVAASFVITALANWLGQNIDKHIGLPSFWLEFLNTILSLLVFASILYLIYRVLPDVEIPPKVVLVSSLVVSALFLIGKLILGIVIGRNSTASAYGAAGSVIVLLLWFYYSAQILLVGAEGIKVYAQDHAMGLPPKRFAVKRHSFEINAKKDVRGRVFEAFARGYKSKTKR